MKRFDTEKGELPDDKEYVLVLLKKDNWGDCDDRQGKRYFRVVKFKKGLSLIDRENLKANDPRKITYCSEDEHSNNRKPYDWSEFGPSSFFGQEVRYWWKLDDMIKENQ